MKSTAKKPTVKKKVTKKKAVKKKTVKKKALAKKAKVRVLDNREKLFVEYYPLEMNPETAAIKAGYAVTTAKGKSWSWVGESRDKCPDNKKHVWDAVQKRLKGLTDDLNIDANWLLGRLHEESEADIADLYDDDHNLLPIKQWPLAFRKGLVAGIDVDELFAGSGKDKIKIGHTTKIKLSCRTRIKELIGKHKKIAAFTEEEAKTELHIHFDSKDKDA